MDRDRSGRRRQPSQGRGLRPIHPLLPPEWISRAIRVAMSADDWRVLDGLAAEAATRTPTQARALGEAISALMHLQSAARVEARPSNWMDWERQKTLRLLRPAN